MVSDAREQIELTPPSSLEAEEAVLGAMILDEQARRIGLGKLVPENFYRRAHRIVLLTMQKLMDDGKKITPVLIYENLPVEKDPAKRSSASEITSLCDAAIPAAIEDHIAVLKAKTALRQTILICEDAKRLAYTPGQDGWFLITGVYERLSSLLRGMDDTDFLNATGLVEDYWGDLAMRVDEGQHFSGVSTGFSELDAKIGGFGEGHFAVVGGCTGMGKTAFLLDIVHRQCIQHNVPCAIFSLEMSQRELTGRLLAKVADIPAWKLQQAQLSEDELQRAMHAAGKLKGAPLFICDTSGLDLGQLRAKAAKVVAREEVRFVIVDYLQQVASRIKGRSRQEEVSSVAQGLKALARELNIPVIAGAQVNREYLSHRDKRPKLDEIRESSSIAHEADSVLFLHRPRRFDKNKGPESEVIVRKARHGQTGTVHVIFDEATVSFREE